MHSILVPLTLLLTVVPAAGCGYGYGLGDSCPLDSAEAPVRVLTEPELRPVPGDRADLGLDLTSSLEEPTRVTVEVGDRTALDVEVPAAGAECAHHPVHRYAYDLPGERVRVTASTDGDSASRTVVLGREQRWVVVQVQQEFGLSMEVYDEQPAYG